MNPRLQHMLAALPARQLNLILVGAVLIVALLAWSVALRAPLAAWRQQGAILAVLEASAPTAQAAAAGAASPEPEPAPAAGSPVVPVVVPQPLELIAAVSRSAERTGVAISAAAQGQPLNAAGLRLQMIDIAASGSYGAVLAWLAEIEATQPAVGINGVELQPGASGGERRIRLQLAIYDIGPAP